jgi:hypothetical protein
MLLPTKLRKDLAEVTLVSFNKELHERLGPAFKADKRFQFRSVDGALAQFVADVDPAGGPSVLIADLDEDPSAAITSIESLRRHRFDGSIVAISDTLGG